MVFSCKKLRVVLSTMLLFLFLAAVAIWQALPSLISARILSGLHNAGFQGASLQAIDIYYNAIHISGLDLAPGHAGQNINNIEIYYSPSSLLKGRIERIFLDQVDMYVLFDQTNLHIPGRTPYPTTQNDQADDNLSKILKDIPIDAIEMRSANLVFNFHGSEIALNLAGRMERRPKGNFVIHGRLRGKNDDTKVSSKIEGAIDKDGALKLSLNIQEARLSHHALKTNRFTGWASLNRSSDGQIASELEIAAGILDIADIGLRNVTLTYNSANSSHHAIFRGQAPDNAGTFVIDYDSEPDGDQYKNQATLSVKDAALSHFQKFLVLPDGRNISGTLNIDLMTSCTSKAPLPVSIEQCKQVRGNGALNLHSFSVTDLFSDAVAKFELSLQSANEERIRITASNGAELSLVHEKDFPLRDLITSFAGPRLTLNLYPHDGNPPYMTISNDNELIFGGAFDLAGQNDNALHGRIDRLSLSKDRILAKQLFLLTTLTKIETPAIETQKSIFEFHGDLLFLSKTKQIELYPSDCVLVKAEKLQTSIYQPDQPFDTCIPTGSDKTLPWLSLQFQSNENGLQIVRSRYNGGIPALPLVLNLKDDKGPYRVTGTLPRGEVNTILGKDFIPQFIAAQFKGGGKLTSSKAPYVISGIEGKILYSALNSTKKQIDTKLSIHSFRHHAPHPYFKPLSVDFESSSDLNKQEMRFIATIMDDVGSFVAELKGTHKLNENRGFGTFKIYPVEFGLSATPMQQTFPFLKQWINRATGKLEADTAISWAHFTDETSIEIDGEGVVKLTDFIVETPDITAAGINAQITIEDIWPLTIPPKQTITISAADIGIPLTDGVVLFSLTSDKILDIEQFEWKLAKGSIVAEPFAIPLDALGKTIYLEANNIDLASLAIMSEIDGLEATGTLNGVIPVTVSPQGFSIDKGKLEAAGNGFIRYNPNEIPPALSGDNEQIKTVRNALKNLKYNALSLEISGGSEGSQNIHLHLSGNNPDFYGGHPVDLNLNLDGDLGALIRQSINALDYTDKIIRNSLDQHDKNENTTE